MQTQRKEWWEAQKKSILDEFKAHERLVKAAVKRVKGNLMKSTSNSLGSQKSNASEVARDEEKEVLSKIQGLEEGALESNDKKLQEKNGDVDETENYEGVEKVQPKETEDTDYSNTMINLTIPTTMKTLLGRKIMKLLRKSKLMYTKSSSQKPKKMTRTATNQ